MFRRKAQPLRGKAGLASQGTIGRIGRSTTHYGRLTAGAADQAGPAQLGPRHNGPGPKWGAECDVGHDRVGAGLKAIRGYVPEEPATLCEGTVRP